MFPSKHRLRNEKDIKTLLAHGKSVFDLTLGLKFGTNNLPVSRFAVVVGTKVSKRAVDRNRVKRRIRAVVEKRLLKIKSGFDVLFLVKKESLEKTFKEIEEQIDRMFRRAKLL